VGPSESPVADRDRTWLHRRSLDTTSFQARPFYEKLGYAVFGTLDDHPLSHAHYLLRKQLRAS